MHTLTDELTDVQREADDLKVEDDALSAKVAEVTKRARDIHGMFVRNEKLMKEEGYPAPVTEELMTLKERFITFLSKEAEKSIETLRQTQRERVDLQRRI